MIYAFLCDHFSTFLCYHLYLCFLKKYQYQIENPRQAQLIYCDYDCLDFTERKLKDMEACEKLLKISKSVKFILDNNAMDYDNQKVYKRYRFFLKRSSLLDSNGNVIKKKLYDKMKTTYGEKLLDKLNCGLNKVSSSEWLINLTHTPKYVIEPIKHILLINILVENIEHFFSLKNDKLYINKRKNFEDNLKELYKGKILELISEHAEITRTEIRKKLLKEYKYLEKTDKEWFNKNIPKSLVEKYTSESLEKWKEILKNFIENTPNVSRSMIKNVYRNEYEKCRIYDREWFELNMPKSRVKYIKDFETERKERRKSLLQYIDENPNNNRSEVREAITNTYNWLYKNDKEWLDINFALGYQTSYEKKENNREIYRKRVLEYIYNTPVASRDRIRKDLPIEHKWLYRNDKKWFNLNMPEKESAYKKEISINRWEKKWKEIDEEVVKQLTDKYNNIHTNAGYNKITKNYILNNLDVDYKSSIIHSLQKLSKSKDFVEKVIESSEDYELRKVKMARDKLLNSEEKMTKSKLLKEAKIPKYKFESVKNLIAEIVEINHRDHPSL